MNSSLQLYCELYRRGEYAHIPLGKFPSGELFYPTDKQIRAFTLLNDPITTIIGFGGSARAGKSILECTAIIIECMAYPDIAWGLARKELTTLKRTVLNTLFVQLKFYGVTEDEYKYNQQLNSITFNNGSIIYLIDTATKPSDPLNTRFGGLELTRAAIDESNETSIDVVNKIFERVGWRNNDKYGLKRKLFECFNPSKNHVYTRFYLPFRSGTEPEHKKFIASLPTDNPHPSVQEWVKDIIANGDKVTIERQVYGNFEYDDDPAALVDYDSISNMFTNDHVDAVGTKYISADIAMQGRDRFVAGFWEGMVCTIEIDMEKATGRSIELSLMQMKVERGVMNTNIVADSDGMGSYIESYIENLHAFRGNKRATEDEYMNIKSQCGFKLAEVINQGKIKIVCTQQQEALLKEELGTCLKRDRIDSDTQKKRLIPKDKMKALLGRSPDYMDMLLMRMVYEVEQEFDVFL